MTTVPAMMAGHVSSTQQPAGSVWENDLLQQSSHFLKKMARFII
jgi:hypothetical protein